MSQPHKYVWPSYKSQRHCKRCRRCIRRSSCSNSARAFPKHMYLPDRSPLRCKRRRLNTMYHSAPDYPGTHRIHCTCPGCCSSYRASCRRPYLKACSYSYSPSRGYTHPSYSHWRHCNWAAHLPSKNRRSKYRSWCTRSRRCRSSYCSYSRIPSRDCNCRLCKRCCRCNLVRHRRRTRRQSRYRSWCRHSSRCTKPCCSCRRNRLQDCTNCPCTDCCHCTQPQFRRTTHRSTCRLMYTRCRRYTEGCCS